jgi:hypothetical protein
MNVDTHVFAGQRCEDVLRRACVEVSHGIGMACWSVCVCVCVCVCCCEVESTPVLVVARVLGHKFLS